MKIQLHFAAFIVHFGLISVHTYDENGYQLRNFPSLSAKYNSKDKKSYIETLQTGVVKSQHTFNAMKYELQRARNTNSQKRSSLIKRKRETAEEYYQRNVPTPIPASAIEEQLEDEYLKHWEGTEPREQREWTTMRDLWFGENYEEMRKFCAEIHSLSGKGSLDLSKAVVRYNINYLRFRGKNSPEFARIDVLTYSENLTSIVSNEVFPAESERLHITNGLRPECVYYLKPTDHTKMEFFLEEHFCKKISSEASIASTTAGTISVTAVTTES